MQAGNCDHCKREQDVGRKRRHELRNWLQPLGPHWTQTNPHPDRHPDQAGDDDQHNHPQHGRQAQTKRRGHVAQAQRGLDEPEQVRTTGQATGHDQPQPQIIDQPRHGGRGPDLPDVRQHAPVDQHQALPRGGQQRAEHGRQTRATQQAVHPGARTLRRSRLLEAEFVRPSDNRTEQQLVVGEDHQRHCAHCPCNGHEVFLLNGQRQPRTDARQIDGGIAHRNRLAGHHEKPASGHRHHHVPDQPGNGERQLQPGKTKHGRQAELAADFAQVTRYGAQRLIKTECNIPRLAGKNGEDGGTLDAQLPTGKQAHEKRDGKRQKPQYRNRLKNIQRRNNHLFSLATLCRQRGHHKGKNQRSRQRDKHAQSGTPGILGQPRGVEAYRA
ncbi:hypothetical protein ALP56_200163 [Pseudomonas coronafaciens pv. oryzae]|nr:hypothetical protein ALP56_200163 [Pseudomonas coronafaciens pv. oryzae]